MHTTMPQAARLPDSSIGDSRGRVATPDFGPRDLEDAIYREVMLALLGTGPQAARLPDSSIGDSRGRVADPHG